MIKVVIISRGEGWAGITATITDNNLNGMRTLRGTYRWSFIRVTLQDKCDVCQRRRRTNYGSQRVII